MTSFLSRLWQTIIRCWFGVKAKARPCYQWQWRRQATRLRRCQFLVLLAQEVADDLLVNRPFGVTVEALVEGVRECHCQCVTA